MQLPNMEQDFNKKSRGRRQIRPKGECMNNGITEKQRRFIEDMNEFCTEKFDFKGKTKKEASEYISEHIEEYKLATMDNWQTAYV